MTEFSLAQQGNEPLNHVNAIMESHLRQQRDGSFYGNKNPLLQLNRNSTWHRSQKSARKNYKQIKNIE